MHKHIEYDPALNMHVAFIIDMTTRRVVTVGTFTDRDRAAHWADTVATGWANGTITEGSEPPDDFDLLAANALSPPTHH